MGFRKKKKVEEEVVEVVEELPAEEETITGEIESDADVVAEEEIKEEVKEEPVKEEKAPVSSDIRIGSKVHLIRPVDYDGRSLDIDTKTVFKVYAIEGDKVQLRTARGNIFFVKLTNLKKVD